MMLRVGRAVAQALLYAGVSVPVAVALSYAEVYLLGHVSDKHTAGWHVSLGISTKLYSLVFAVPIFTLGALLRNRNQGGWHGAQHAAMSGLIYFLPLTAIGSVTWGRSGGLVTALLVLMFAHLFFSPFLLGRWTASTGQPGAPPVLEPTHLAV